MWDCIKTCQCSKVRNLIYHWVSGWLEARASGSNFKSMQSMQCCRATIVSPDGFQTRISGVVPWETASKIWAPNKCISSLLGGIIQLYHGQLGCGRDRIPVFVDIYFRSWFLHFTQWIFFSNINFGICFKGHKYFISIWINPIFCSFYCFFVVLFGCSKKHSKMASSFTQSE